MKAYGTLWGYCSGDQWVAESTRLHRTSWDSLFSLRNGFTAYNVLSPVTGFLATVASRALPQNLTPASGRQNHTSSPYASAPFVKGASASTASHRTFVTIAIRPSFG